MGSLGQPIYSPKGTCVRIGAKVGSRVLKESLGGAFWVPFGRLLDDISDDLGCILNTPFLGILLVFITYSFGIHHVFCSYSLSFFELFFQYSLGIA